MDKNKYPKISYVTPVYNQVEFIEQTILSVINQEYPNFEYIIVDGGSTDGTLEVIKKFDDQLFKVISEPDTGMYDALGKGFKISSGEIMGWINSDDILLPGAFLNMARLFNDLPQVNWIQGLNGFIDLKGEVIGYQMPKQFSFIKFLSGDFKWIQQESTFWRRTLWEKAGSIVNAELKLAGDFELWFRFFQNDKLYNSSLLIGAWRKREGQLSERRIGEYLNEADYVINSYKRNKRTEITLQQIRKYEKYTVLLKKSKLLNYNIFTARKNRLHNLSGLNIHFSYSEQKFFTAP